MTGNWDTQTQHLAQLVDHLAQERWWLDGFHLFDFFTNDLWAQVDPEWRRYVEEHASSDELLNEIVALAVSGKPPVQWPESLKAFVRKAGELSRDRTVEKDEELGILAGEQLNYDAATCRQAAMTPKKLHEVDRLSRVVFTVAERSHVDTIIDIGAGHGYLTHLVATQNPSRRVVAIDCEDARTCGSKDRGSRILSSVHHQVPAAMLNFGGYHHRLKLDPTWTSKVEYATARLDPATLSETCGGGKGSRYALVGLHSCGDLSGVTMLTTFLECGDVKAVVVVACCYQRITTGSGPNDAAAGIPLSQTVKDLTSHRNPPFTLTHRVLSSAQLTFASFADSTTIISSFKGHYHRSLFELALRRWSTMHPASFDRLGLNEPASFSSGPSFRVGGLPKACTRNFRAYCLAAAGKMGLLVGEDVEQDLGLGRSLDGLILELQEEFPVERMLPRIALMCVLRSVLGPCVEALVLLDRVKYLEEGLGCGPNGEAKGKVWLRNIFENDLSPRNAAIVAEKTDGGQI